MQIPNDIDIREAFKALRTLIEKLPPTNTVLRSAAIKKLMEASDSAIVYWQNQNAISKEGADGAESEYERIKRIVEPYIRTEGNKHYLLGESYLGRISFAVMQAAATQILEAQAREALGLQKAGGAPMQAGGEEKKPTSPDAAPLQSTSIDSQLRDMRELFANSTIAGSVFGEAILGTDKGATTLAAMDKALGTIQTTTSLDSLMRGGNMIDPHIAICIAFALRLIDESEINLAHGSGLTVMGKGNKAASIGLTKTIVVSRIVDAVRPELLEAAEAKKKANKK